MQTNENGKYFMKFDFCDLYDSVWLFLCVSLWST